MTGYMFHEEMIKRMMKSTVNHDAQILETAYETGRKQGQTETINAVLEIIDKWEKHLSNYTDGIYVQGQKMMLAHIRCDVLILKGGEQE